MNILYKLLLTVVVFSFLIVPVLAIEDFKNINIYINNQVVTDIKECNINLKPNDVLKVVGKNSPNRVIEISIFNEIYKRQTDENGDWLLLLSVPYIDNGSYTLDVKLDSSSDNVNICEINITEESLDSNETVKEESNNISTILIISSLIIVLSLISFFILRKSMLKK